MAEDDEEAAPGLIARRLIRRLDRAALGTVMRPREDGAADGHPYASLVLVACAHDATPLLLISDLSDHAKNIAADDRVALLFDGTAGRKDPLTGPRASVLGRAERTADAALRARYLARHPSAELYADFTDFALYRVRVERAHLVAGFGRIHWLAADDVLYHAAPEALAAAEPDIVAHMNRDHHDAIQAYAGRLLGRAGTDWRMTGIDPEGADLRQGGEVARLEFGAVVPDAGAARAELVRLARATGAGGAEGAE